MVEQIIWAIYIGAALSIVAAVVLATLVMVKKLQLEQLRAQLLKQAKAIDTAEAEAEMVMIGQPRAEKKRASAELKDMNTRLYALEGFVAIQAREFINYKARFGHHALTLLVIGLSGVVAQFLIMIYEQAWAT